MQGKGLSPEIDREAADALDDATRPLLPHLLSSSDSLLFDEEQSNGALGHSDREEHLGSKDNDTRV